MVDCGLIIQLDQLASVPECLGQFLADETICFVGIKLDNQVTSIQRHGLRCVTAVEVADELAARILQKPILRNCGLVDIRSALGRNSLPITGLPERIPDWNARFFTHGEIKYAILDARSCYRIGARLLRKLNL